MTRYTPSHLLVNAEFVMQCSLVIYNTIMPIMAKTRLPGIINDRYAIIALAVSPYPKTYVLVSPIYDVVYFLYR